MRDFLYHSKRAISEVLSLLFLIALAVLFAYVAAVAVKFMFFSYGGV